MKKAYVFLAPGFEDVEALIPVDVLRRGGVDVTLVGVEIDQPMVQSAHGVTMMTDVTARDVMCDEVDLLVLPGGMPGAENLFECDFVRFMLNKQAQRGALIGAICAAPAVVLGQLGLIPHEKVTCYPGFEHMLHGGEYTGELVTVSNNFVTGEGPAAAFPFAFELLKQLTDQQTAQSVADGMRYTHLMEIKN